MFLINDNISSSSRLEISSLSKIYFHFVKGNKQAITFKTVDFQLQLSHINATNSQDFISRFIQLSTLISSQFER
ncbi:hypothetical protein ACFLY2_00495 [Patescibacteria group bacterium]